MKIKGLGGGAGRSHPSAFAQIGIRRSMTRWMWGRAASATLAPGFVDPGATTDMESAGYRWRHSKMF